MDFRNVVGPGETQQIAEVLQIFMMLGKPLAAHTRFVQTQRLKLRSHGAVEQQNLLGQQGVEFVSAVGHGIGGRL